MNEMSPPQGKAGPIRFNHHSPEHAANWPAYYRDMRESNPRAWSETFDGFWLATRLRDIVGVAQNAEAFSVAKRIDPGTGEAIGGVTIPASGGTRVIPNEADNPEWEGLRRLINRRFAPRAIEERRQRARRFTAALIDMVIEQGECDLVDDLTSPLPAIVTMDLLGFPLEDWRAFADPFHKMTSTPTDSPEHAATMEGLYYYQRRAAELIAQRRREPKDDLFSLLVTGEAGGAPLDDETVMALAFNIMAGGVDTTTALASNTFIYLARNPQDRRRLIDEPELLPVATEEFLRYFTPIHALGRTAAQDTEVDGWKIGQGERVLLAYAAGNRDPEAFEDPETVRIDRFPNKHVAFGAGMHRCVGSFLARLMFQEMITAVLERMPDYQIDEAGLRRYASVGTVNGWTDIPCRFTPGSKVGATIG
jgi:cytochrome P450